MWTTNDVAEYLKVHPRLVQRLAAAGHLRHVRVGLGRGTYRFKREYVEEYVESLETHDEESLFNAHPEIQ